ncbi:MAG: 6-carboxytetrahydropterin synthase [Acidobacteriota bacterium]
MSTENSYTEIDPKGVFTVVLAKQDFKFSSGHFTIFGPDEAEWMHGHNYTVKVEFTGRALDSVEMVVNFVDTKKAIRALCERLDTQVLLPENSPLLEIERLDDGRHLELRYADRRYVMPEEDVQILPVVNTSVEAFARFFWQYLDRELDLSHLDSMGVCIDETDGQGCWYRAPLG